MKGLISLKTKKLSFCYSLFLFTLLWGCDDLNDDKQAVRYNITNDSVDTGYCYAVEGNVLGRLNPNSSVNLYRSSRTEFNYIMNYVRENRPDEKVSIHARQEFQIDCLYPGSYILAIPAKYYNKSMGAPLPFEFECPNATLKILYQGGDSSFWVGVFTLNTPANIESITANRSLGYSILGPRSRPCPI